MSVSVIIPSCNLVNLRACLEAAHLQDPLPNYIVVGDGVEADQSIPHWDQWTTGSQPFVFARNCNIGIEAAGSDDVVLLNDDALLETPRGFTAMQQYIANHPLSGLLSTRVKGPAWPIHQYHAGGPSVWRCYGEVTPVARDVPFVCIYIPRRVLDAVGPLDERFGGEIDGEKVYGGEDNEYCYRARKAGYRLGVFNGCVVDHGSLPSTFRGLNGSLPVNATRKRFREIHGFEMGAR